jgi:signal transduction histidine kinase
MNSATNHHPLRDGNRLQRAYYRWALPYYERFGAENPELRAEVEEIDQFLYTRKGGWAWLGWLMGLTGCVAGMTAAGMPWALATGLSLLIWLGMSFALMGAWLAPRKPASEQGIALTRKFLLGLVAGGLAALVGLGLGHWMRHGHLDGERLVRLLENGAPIALLIAAGLGLLVNAVAWASRQARGRRLARLALIAERDAAARHASEADLRLLQAQIHPHFVFNTLATLQHWVDKKDERAGALLRELTGFLRASTEMLGRSSVPLSEELQAVRHYLTILQTRLGERLQWQIDADPSLQARALPPGLLLTLVENAIEHGLEPKIGGGRLWVQAQSTLDGWRLAVLDDGQGIAPGSRDNVGLANLRQRLQHHFGAAARFTLSPRAEGGTQAEMHLP